MYRVIENEEELIDYYLKRIAAINDEMKDLEKTPNMQEYYRLKKSEEVREYKKLKQEKDFLNANLITIRENIEKKDNKGRTI